MAFVSSGYVFQVSLMDNGGDITTKTYELDSADAAAAATDSASVLAALLGVTDATIISYKTYEQFVNDSAVYPGAGIENQNQALLVFSIDGNPLKKATHAIPAPKIGIFTSAIGPGAEIVDTADAAIVTYRSLFQSAGPAYISDGEKADVLLSRQRRHVKSRRG